MPNPLWTRNALTRAQSIEKVLNLSLSRVLLKSTLNYTNNFLADGALIDSGGLDLESLGGDLGGAELQQTAHLGRRDLRLDELNKEGDVGGNFVADRSELLEGAVIDDCRE